MHKTRARIALLFVLTLLIAVGATRAQQTYNVVEVEVVGNRVASKSLILGVSSIHIGSPLTPVITGETIRRLYGLGIFSDVQINAEEVMGGIKVYIIVKELPKLAGLEFKGNDKIKSKELKEKLGLGVGGYISPFLIDKKKAEIKKLYEAKGYFQATVKSSLELGADSTEAILTYHIDEKSKVKVDAVILTGTKRVEPDEVVGVMRNRRRGLLRSSDFAQEKYAEDLEKVINEFHKKGFIDAYLLSDSISIDTSINRMKIYLEVYEGPRYYFGQANFKNNVELPTARLEKALKYGEGDVFDAEKYNKSLEEIYTAYYDIGHLNIRLFDERTTRNDSLIDITYEISEGLPSNINLVKIVGNTKTKDKVVRREITALPGQRFSRELLIRSVREVMALNYFANVVPEPISLPNGDVDIEFKVEEKQTGQVSAGAGYNSQDKVVGNLGVGIPNFRGMGQSVSFNTEFGNRRNSLSLSFTEPWLFGRPTLMGADLYTLNRRWFSDYTEGRQGGSIRLGRRLRWPDNYFRVIASYRLERARYHDFSDSFIYSNSYKTITKVPASTSTPENPKWDVVDTALVLHAPYPGSILQYMEEWNAASRISFTIQRDSRNLPEFATSGSKVTYTFENTGGLLGGYWDYQKHSVSVAKFIPLFWNFALAAKVQYGVITSSDPTDRSILLSDRFTPGGTAYDGIVRGYDDGSLTPDSTVIQSDTLLFYFNKDNVGITEPDSIAVLDNFTIRVRGKYMFVSNIELQLPIVNQQIYALAFFDAGNSWLRRRDIRLDDLYRGVGVGFRIVVPGIGTLGFDFGYALDEVIREDGTVIQSKGWKPHFQIGTTFR